MLQELNGVLPEDLANHLNVASLIEVHRIRVSRARERLLARKKQMQVQATLDSNKQQALEEKRKLDTLNQKPAELHNRLDAL